MKRKKKLSSPLEKPVNLLALGLKPFVSMLIQTRSKLIEIQTGLIGRFNMQFKSKRTKKTSIGIENSSSLRFEYGENTSPTLCLFPTFIDNLKIGKRQSKEVKKLKIDKDCRLSFDGYSLWICIPVQVENKKMDKNDRDIIALDPGTRTFLTGYDPNGKILKLHRNDELTKKIKSKIQLMQSLRDKKLIRKKSMNKYQYKLKNVIDDFH